jgi:hypothetical protein
MMRTTDERDESSSHFFGPDLSLSLRQRGPGIRDLKKISVMKAASSDFFLATN